MNCEQQVLYLQHMYYLQEFETIANGFFFRIELIDM